MAENNKDKVKQMFNKDIPVLLTVESFPILIRDVESANFGVIPKGTPLLNVSISKVTEEQVSYILTVYHNDRVKFLNINEKPGHEAFLGYRKE